MSDEIAKFSDCEMKTERELSDERFKLDIELRSSSSSQLTNSPRVRGGLVFRSVLRACELLLRES